MVQLKRGPPPPRAGKLSFLLTRTKVDVCKDSFQSTSQRLKAAIQRDIRSGGGDEAETGGLLKYCINPEGELKSRVLPPPTFCTRTFDEVIG